MLTPLEAANVRDLGMRILYPVNVKFNYFPPSQQSKKYGPFRRTKEHMTWTCSVLPTLDQSELFKILQRIKNCQVDKQWEFPVRYLWNLKRTNKFLEQVLLDDNKLVIVLGDGETELIPIEYPEDAKFVNKFEE